MKPVMLIGAPGTGKTYELIELIKQVKPEKFAFLSFTRRAAREAWTRLSSIYNESELKYIRTIHSLCFDLLGLKTSQVLSYKHIMEFANQYGYEFTPRAASMEDGTWYGMTDDDIEYRTMQIQIAKMEELNPFDSGMLRSYNQFKTERQLIDFHDMIRLVLEKPELVPKFDLVCIDEIQDLSPLQMQLVYSLLHRANATIFAGDGDQMIFEWAGVDRQAFLKLQRECNIHKLETNYRIPDDILFRAQSVLKGDSYHAGSSNTHLITGLPEFKPDETYLILSRNAYILRNIMREYDEQGFSWTWLSNNQYLPKGTKFNINVSTIHGAKGAEADNVVIIPDVSPATYENLDSDAERRVWYVGLTRTRKCLYLVEPQTSMFYDLL